MSENSRITYWLIVTGEFGSGKSTFVKTLCKNYDLARHFDKNTVNLRLQALFPRFLASDNYGEVSIDERHVLSLYTPDGCRRFDMMWELDQSESEHDAMLGHIIIFDSAYPQDFRETRSIIETFRAYSPHPWLIAANFQDHPDAWLPDDLRIALRISDEIPIVPCVATEYNSVKQVVITLLEQVLETFSE